MTDVDRTTEAERALRDAVHRQLQPPPTPIGLRAAVDELAANPPAVETRRAHVLGAGRRGSGVAVAVLAAAAAIVIALIALPRGLPEQVGTTPPPASLPAVSGPALPSPASNPTRLESAGWLDATTATSVDADNRLRITTDGGQTWSEPRPLPEDTDLGFQMLDAEHGVIGWAERLAGTWRMYIRRTADGGRTWDGPLTAGTLPVVGSDQPDLFGNLHFVDREHGVFLATAQDGAATIQPDPDRQCRSFATDDAGTTWTETDGPCLRPAAVLWSSARVGATGGAPGSSDVAYTVDGGRWWSFTTLPLAPGEETAAPLLIALAPDATLRILAMVTGDGGTSVSLQVYENHLNGVTWTRAYRPAGLDIVNGGLVSALDGEHWLAATDLDWQAGLQLNESFDAGRTWAAVSTAAISPGVMAWFDRLHGTMQGVPIECTGTACGGEGTVLFTNDGGQTWHLPPF